MTPIKGKKILVPALVIINLVLLLKICHHSWWSTTTVIPIQNEIEAGNDYAPLYELIQYGHISDGRKVKRDAVLVKWNGKSCTLGDLLDKQSRVIFNFRYYNCRTCLDEEISRLRSLQEEIGRHNIVLISAFENKRSHRAFEKEYGFEVFDLGSQSLGLLADQAGLPYIMVLNDDLVARNIYFTTSEFGTLTDSIHEIIKQRYFR
jgi:peroxiredoxin